MPLLLIYQIVTNLTLAGSSVAFWLGSANGSLYLTYDYASSPFQVWSLLFLSTGALVIVPAMTPNPNYNPNAKAPAGAGLRSEQ